MKEVVVIHNSVGVKSKIAGGDGLAEVLSPEVLRTLRGKRRGIHVCLCLPGLSLLLKDAPRLGFDHGDSALMTLPNSSRSLRALLLNTIVSPPSAFLTAGTKL